MLILDIPVKNWLQLSSFTNCNMKKIMVHT